MACRLCDLIEGWIIAVQQMHIGDKWEVYIPAEMGYGKYEGPDATQQPVGRVGNPSDIANMVLYLCSDKAGFITGENICIDGGMTRLMIYHGDNGWTLK